MSNSSEQEQQPQMARRACVECRKKKMGCDKKQPQCSLCARTKSPCHYPSSRRPWTRRNPRKPRTGCLSDTDLNSLPLDEVSFEWGFSSDALDSTMLAPNENTGVNCFESSALVGLLPEPESMPWLDIPVLSCLDDTYTPDLAPLAGGAYDYDPSISALHFQPVDPSSMSTSQNSQIDSCFSFPSSSHPPKASSETTVQWASEAFNKSSQAVHLNKFSLDIPEGMADLLVNVFFQQVQCFLPLLHRPTFVEQYQKGSNTGHKYTDLCIESALLLNAMFGVSARFYKDDDPSNVPPRDKGVAFTKRALELHSEMQRNIEQENPSIVYLQGLIILTYTLLASDPSTRSWNLCGMCCRLAYDLDLHETDADLVADASDQSLLTQEEWVEREERRRAWWMCFELDTFTSAMSHRPFMIDQQRMQVLLPVSDELWFRRIITMSVFVSTPLVQSWKRLRESPNRNERAWFLVVNFLVRKACEICFSWNVDAKQIQNHEAALTYLTLLLPESFNLDVNDFFIRNQTCSMRNWIMCTLITIQSIRAIYAVARYRISEVPERSKFDHHGIDELDKRGVMSLRPADRLAQLCNGYLTCITQTIQVWPPQHIALSSPFITSCLVGPCSIFVHRRDDGDEMGLLSDILLLAIERFSKYWKLADSLMCVCRSKRFHSSNTAQLESLSSCPKESMQKRWKFFFSSQYLSPNLPQRQLPRPLGSGYATGFNDPWSSATAYMF